MASTFVADSAAVSFVDAGGNPHIHVYTSDGKNITERVWDGNGWNDGSFAQPGTKVSATAWYVGGQYFIRVYCSDDAAALTEWCSDGGGAWYQGYYTGS